MTDCSGSLTSATTLELNNFESAGLASVPSVNRRLLRALGERLTGLAFEGAGRVTMIQ